MVIAETRAGPGARAEGIRTRLLYEAHVEFDAPLDVGATPHGLRRIVPIKGGSFQGPSIRGEILPCGADWLLVRPDGIVELDIRAAGRMDDGALLYARERGYLRAQPEAFQAIALGEPVDPGEYTLRVVASFETASERYAWLNGAFGIGVGTLRKSGLDLVVHEVL